MKKLLLLFLSIILCHSHSWSQTCIDGACPGAIVVEQLNAHEFAFTLDGSCPDAQATWYWNNTTPQSAMAQTVYHSFAEPGTYYVVAVVEDSDCPGGIVTLQTSVTVIEEICNPTPVVNQITCNFYEFSTSVPVDSVSMYWTVSTTNFPLYGNTIQQYFPNSGVYTVTLHVNGTACPDVETSIAVEIGNCNTSCGSDIVEVDNGNACGTYTFQMPGIAPNGNYVWNFGDGGQAGGSSTATHTYDQPGTYIVSSTTYTSSCPNGQTRYYTVVVPQCENNGIICPDSISFSQTECGLLTFNPDIEEQANATVGWQVGNSLSQGFVGSYFMPSGGYAQVCMYYTSPTCPGIQICSLAYVAPCSSDNTLQIDTLQINGDLIVLSASGVENPDSIVWSINGVMFNQGAITTIAFGNSPLLVCVYYNESDVLSPLQECFYIDSPNAVPCPTGINVSSVNQCNEFVFWISNVETNDPVYWSFGGSNTVLGDSIISHTFDQPGEYQVYVAGYSSACGEQYGLAVTVNVTDCITQNLCYDSLQVIGTQTCGLYAFEVGSYHEGEVATWYFYNNETTVSLEGGHYMEYQFPSPGIWWVEMGISSNDCPEIQGHVVMIEVPNCNTDTCWVDFAAVANNGCQGVTFEAWAGFETNAFDWYIDEVYYGSGQTINLVGPYGFHNVCVKLSPNVCANAPASCGSFFFEECNPTCDYVYITAMSNTSTGGTPMVACSLRDENNNAIYTHIFSFGENTVATDSVCVPHGCYTLVFDSQLPYQSGEGFAMWVGSLSGGDDIASMNDIVIMDNYAFVVPFGFHSECGTSAECDADFEIVTVQPGVYNFINTSLVSGNASYTWTFSDGSTAIGTDAYMTYVEGGEQVVCLSLLTETGCASDTCLNFYAEPINVDPCFGLTPVVIQLGSDMGSMTSGLTLHIQVASDFGSIVDTTVTLSPGQLQNVDLCAPAGCFDVSIEGFNWANLSDALLVNMFVNGVAVNQVALTETFANLNTVMPVLTDCSISVVEKESTDLAVFPNPSNNALNLRLSHLDENAQYRMLDQNGRLVLSGILTQRQTLVDVSGVASGIYMLEVTNSQQVSTNRICIQH